jgi:hypothetical protein
MAAMPPEKESKPARLKRFVELFGQHVYSTDQKILYCKLCECAVSADQKSQVESHIKTKTHENAVKNLNDKEKEHGTRSFSFKNFRNT